VHQIFQPSSRCILCTDPLFSPLFKKQRRSSVVRSESTNLSRVYSDKVKDKSSSSAGIQSVTKIKSVQSPDDGFLKAAEEGASKWGLRERLTSPKDKDQPTKPIVAPRTPARVEPKSFFANERTFIQWVSAALLLMTAAELFLVASSASAIHTWNFLMSSAVLVALYGLVTYHRRLHLMINSKPYGYAGE
jgi:Vacuolar transporter chaperone